MKLKLTALFFLTLAFSSYSVAKDGSVEFYGTVVDAACVVSAASQDQIVQMGQVRSNQFSDVSSWSRDVPFQIVLEDCENDVRKSVAVSFSGATDENDPQVFKAGSGADSAKGVGIGIFDFNSQLIMPGGEPLRYTEIFDGQTVLNYSARYRRTGTSITSGNANSQVWFRIYYQ